MKKIKFAKYSMYSWLTAALAAVFFIVGLFTLGNPKTTGETFSLAREKVAVYNLTYSDGQTYLKDVYVNVGSIYASEGETVNLLVQTSTSSTSKSWTNLATLKLANGDGEGAKDFAFNWSVVAKDMPKKATTIKRISFSADANIEINEIVCVADNGEKMTLTVNASANAGIKATNMANAFDAQGSFKFSERGYDNLTEEEGRYLSAIRLIRSGKTSVAESVYSLPEDFNALALVFMAFPVWMFGDSAFALRLTPFIATTLTLIGVYLLFALLFKKQKYGFVAAVTFALGCLATTVGRLGAPYALVTCALIYSLYFMYKFFAKGISSSNVVLGAWNVLLSGLFGGVAIAMDTVAVVPVVGILAVFAFGMARQRRAYILGKEKNIAEYADGSPERVKAEKIAALRYAEKNRAAFGFATLGFVVGTFIFLLVGAVSTYYAYAKTYGADVSFAEILWFGLSSAWNARIQTVSEYNVVLLVCAVAAFVFTTVRVIIGFAKKATEQKSVRVARIYFVLLGGVIFSVLAAALKGAPILASSLLFVFVYGFLPLAAYSLERDGEKGKIGLSDWLLIAVLVAAIVGFVTLVPTMYGL